MTAREETCVTAPAVRDQGILSIRDLVVDYRAPGRHGRRIRAVDGVSLEVRSGQTLGIVGESGSGKSTIGRAVLGLVSPAAGTITFDGHEITHVPADKRRELTTAMSVVFQDPYSSLNPAYTVGQLLSEPLRVHRKVTAAHARQQIAALLEQVGLPPGAVDRMPGDFSGGQRQRIAIARALCLSPSLIICDEPVSALDVSTQAQVINLLSDLQADRSMAYVFIAHDLAVVHHISDQIAVIYRGQIMESGPAGLIYRDPAHPYTQTLLAAEPVANPDQQAQRRKARQQLAAARRDQRPPDSTIGCPFAARCPHVMPVCASHRPPLTAVRGRQLACHLYPNPT